MGPSWAAWEVQSNLDHAIANNLKRNLQRSKSSLENGIDDEVFTGRDAAMTPREIALQLLQATALPDQEVFARGPWYTVIDYYRMACQLLFKCKRCGTCCTTADPIRLRNEDVALLARHFKLPVNKAIKKYLIIDPDEPGIFKFKKISPCRFYDPALHGCKIYTARPWSCRIFPFLGIYGCEDRVLVHESCPGSVEAVRELTAALEAVRSDPVLSASSDQERARGAKELLRQVLGTA
jgi:Fe-S-cluster containining protein